MGVAQKPLILIVDDNPQNIQVLGNTIQEEGYEVAFALNGSQALDFLGKEMPDLILLDIMMPEMDGYTVCETIKANHSIKNIPVIFLTAKQETEDIVRGFEVGAVDYVTKPFNPVELLARVRTHLEIKRSREEISSLRGIIPICAKCKRIRDDQGFWDQVEHYIEKHSDALFTHGVCPDCNEELYGDQEWYRKMKQEEGPLE
ncbi:MAG: response regulator [Proteobacteria bacterium]|nr:response regulator [Pseudomonadota bacterium]